ncbi:MAG: hypothetical protein ACR2PZ_12020 [Pseudomonadales bacterium]
MSIRFVGGALLLMCVLLFQPGAETATQRLWLPLLMGIGAALTLRNALAVLVTGALLGMIRMEIGSTDWISAQAYPAIAITCALAAVWILARRFRLYMIATRAQRRAQKQRAE